MKKILPAFLLFFFFHFTVSAQCPTANFNFSGPVCPEQAVSFNNTSSNSTSYQWDFCAGDFHTVPVGADNATTIASAFAMTTVFDGTNWYGFVVSSSTAAITRFDFGTSLSNNNPTSVSVTIPGGFFTVPLQNNLSFIHESGNWYALISNFSANNALVKLDFGSSLTNTSPVLSTITVQFQNRPLFQTLVIDSGNIFLFSCNIGDNNVTVSNFGNSINNTPVNSFITVPGAGSPSDIVMIKTCNLWYGMMTNYGGSVARLDFGSSLNNLPSVTTLTVPGLSGPASITMDNDGEGWYAFVQNDGSSILKLSFGTNITNAPSTSVLSVTPVIGIGKKLTMEREGSDHYLFGTSVDFSRFSKIKFASPCSADTQITTSASPSISFGLGGTYYVTLKAMDANGNTDFHYDSVTINPAPTSDFSYVNTLEGDTTFFTNLSTIGGGGTIVSRSWDFGDATSDTSLNPKHLYVSSGVDTVSLTSTADNGCTNTKKIIITIVPKLTADFSTPDSACRGQALSINNTTMNGATYQWDFCAGDFRTNPSTSDNNGIVTDPFAMTTVFDGTNWYGFEVNSSAATITRFDFGPSLSNINPTPVLLNIPSGYLFAGLKNNLTVLKEGGNWYGVIANFSSNNNLAKLNFGPSLSNTNPTPSLINLQYLNVCLFQDMVIDNGNIYFFFCNLGNNRLVVSDFGNSINNTPVNSFITIPSAASLSDISFVKVRNHWYGMLTCYSGSVVRLDFGLSLSNPTPVITPVTVPGLASPVSIVIDNDGEGWYGFVQNDNGGILKLSFGADITNTPVTTVLALGGIVGVGKKITMANDGSTHYLFGAGETSNHYGIIKFAKPCSASDPLPTSPVPAVSYGTNGSYFIGLIAKDAYGNIDFHLDSVTVNIAPISNFSFYNTCFGDVTQFIDSSTISNPQSITSWNWSFGDFGFSGVPNPSHTYLAVGPYTATLTTTCDNGCTNTKSTVVNITPKPVAMLSALSACSETPVPFSDLSTIASGTVTGWHWDFGNGDTSDVQNPIYTYADGGNYAVSLAVTSDSGCTDFTSGTLNILDRPHAGFDATNTCIGQNVQFLDLTSSISTIDSVLWNFGNGDTSTLSNPSYGYPSVISPYNVTFITYADNGCIDTTAQTIKINNIPVADFNFSPLNACELNNVTFHDLSVVAADTISRWFWDFGDAHTDTVKNPVHQYSTSGNFIVTLTAYSPSSCGNSIAHSVNVIQSPAADFTSTQVCLGTPTSFTDHSTAPTGSTIDHYLWDFGDTFTDTLQNPSHTFTTPGPHLVTLTVTTNFGCTNTKAISITVNHIPVASFVNTNPCTVTSVQFNNTSTMDPSAVISNYAWNFGNPTTGINNTSSQQNPTHLFDTTGSFVVSLITTSNFGCADTAFKILDVNRGSHANFQYLPTCFGDIVQFTNLSYPSSIDSAFVWTFGDNPFNFNPLENPTHYYAAPGTYNVTLTVFATMGCVTTVTLPVTVSPIPVAAFVHSPACIGTQYHFIDSSYISSGTIVSWKWNFAGIDSSTLKNPFFTFPDTGNYLIKLTVTSSIGCSNTITRTIRVQPLPVANFSFTPQYGNPPLNVSFQNLTINVNQSTYEWNFGDNSPVSNLINPQHLYTDTSLFAIQLIATSQFGCKDTIQKNIYVIKPVLDIAMTNSSFYIVDNHLHIVADLANLGTRTISTYKLEANIENGTPIQESYAQVLPNGFQGQQELAASFDLGSGQAKYFCVRVTDPDNSVDDVPSNNEICKSLVKEFSIVNPYPNPFNDKLTLQLILPYKDQMSIDIFDMAGQKIAIFEGEGQEGLNKFEADLGGLANGTYAVRYRFRETEVIKTVLKVELKK